MTQIEAYKSVRKPQTPPTRVIRPRKGGGYNRRDKTWEKTCREIDNFCDTHFHE